MRLTGLLLLLGLAGCASRPLVQSKTGDMATAPSGPDPRDLALSEPDLPLPDLAPSPPFSVIQTTVPGCSGVIDHGDLNGDGKDDLALTCNDGIHALFGHGDGAYDNTTVKTFSGAPYNRLAVAVLNGSSRPAIVGYWDAQIDVVSAAWNGPAWARTNTIDWSGAAESLTVNDFNGDGKRDIAVTEIPVGPGSDPYRLGVALDNGKGGFTRSEVSLSAPPGTLHSGDFDGDKHVDLFVALSGNLQFFKGVGDGTFVPSTVLNIPSVSDGSWGLAAGDVDDDGRADLLASNGAAVYLVTDHMSLTTQLIYQVGDPKNEVANLGAVGDLNHDGRPDILLGGSFGLLVLMQTSSGQFSAPVAIPGNFQRLNSLVITDVNGDGLDDIAVVINGSLAIIVQR
jgi:hypothetical protein